MGRSDTLCPAERNAEPLVQDVLIPDQPVLFSFDSDTPNFLDLRLDMFVTRQEIIPTEELDVIDLSQILRISKENPSSRSCFELK